MSMKLSPIMSPTGLGLREYNSWVFQLIIISRPQQSKLTLNTFHANRRKSHRKSHRVNPPSHQLQKWRGGGERHPTTWAGCNTHRTATRLQGRAAPVLVPAEDTATSRGGNAGPRPHPLTPKGTPEAREARQAGRKIPLSLKGRSRTVLGQGLSQDRAVGHGGDSPCARARRPREPGRAPPGASWGRSGRRGAAASRLRGSSS